MKRYLSIVLLVVFIFLSGCGNITFEVSNVVEHEDVVKEDEVKELLKIHFIDVGQGDSILIQLNKDAMLIDAGGNEYGDTVVEYIKAQGIDRLQYIIGTHPHEDHVGGLDDVIHKIDTDTVLLPKYTLTTKTYTSVLEAIKEKKVNRKHPKLGEEYTLGNGKFTIISPVQSDYGDNANNYSVGIKFEYKNVAFVSIGDAEVVAEKDILKEGFDLEADLYKVSHHGSDTSNSDDLLEAIDPIYGVISVGEGNSYGHPNTQIVNSLLEHDMMIYRTDKNGTVVATSDGSNFTLKVDEVYIESVSKEQEAKYYKTKTGSKYHLEDCYHLKNSKIEVSISEIKEKKYQPCEVCNPK